MAQETFSTYSVYFGRVSDPDDEKVLEELDLEILGELFEARWVGKRRLYLLR